MNFEDAKREFRRLVVAYPRIEEYLAELSDGNATRDAWCRMLSDIEARDVIEVVDGMCSGQIPVRSDYEAKGDLGISIRTKALAVATKRLQSERMRALRATPDSDMPRYSCHLCRDSGLVHIWHPDTVAMVRRSGEAKSLRTCNAACSCVAGTGLRDGNQRWKPLRVYSATIMCRWVNGKPEEIESWIEDPTTDVRVTAFDDWNHSDPVPRGSLKRV